MDGPDISATDLYGHFEQYIKAVKEVTMGKACGMHGEKNTYRVLRENLKGIKNT